MNEEISRDHYLEEIKSIHTAEDTKIKEKVSSLYSLFKSILIDFLDKDKQYFSNDFARMIYVADKLRFSAELIADLRLLRYIGRNISNFPDKYDKKNYAFVLNGIFKLLYVLFEIEIPKEIADFIKDNDKQVPFRNKKEQQEKVHFVSAIVKDKGKVFHPKNKPAYAEIYCDSEEFGEFQLLVSGMWFDIYDVTWKNASINLFDIKEVSKDKPIYRTTINTLIVLEPDYLIDVTDLAECFQFNGANIYLYFLKRFTKHKPSLAMVAGNIVNSCFDELLENPEADFEEVYYRSLQIKPLQVFSIVKDDPNNAILLKNKVANQFMTLKNVIRHLSDGIFNAEPSFISPLYGLQGRLDVLIEYEDEPNRKDIIELKSGKAPDPDLSIRTESGHVIKTGLWLNHLIQTTCYNLLLDSAYENRTGSSQILYSSTEIYPLRNAENIINKKQEAIYFRNWIISLEMALIKEHYSLLESMNPDEFGNCPPYTKQDIYDFAYLYHSCSQTEREYFNCYTSFISKEIYASKCGLGNNRERNGFSSLWKKSILEKETSYQIISKLKLKKDKSDFNDLHLTFDILEKHNSISSFRIGDIGILYPHNDNPDFTIYKQQIIKCHIKDINSDTIKISVRNKLFRKDIFFENEYFTFEPDYIDSTSKALFSSLFAFLKSSEEKRRILLGLKKPEFEEIDIKPKSDLTDEQNMLLKKALAAQNYFLIQGPPGTGKTSYMLRSIVESIYDNTNENILITAYTNRAVDEICSSIKRSLSKPDFIRLGTKESSVHTENLLYQLSAENSIKDLYKIVNRTRIIIATTSSLLSNQEIFNIKEFDTLIVDESSQILEPQIIGIIAKAKKTIMIGDEKQLPAVVVQKDSFDQEKFPTLNDIELNRLSGSLFERLLRICQKNQWDDSYGMLSMQARMNFDIQELANYMFYFSKLKTLDIITDKSKKSDNTLLPSFLNNSIIFINSEKEVTLKTHYSEAMIVAKIAMSYYQDSDGDTIGIISPFRAQCSLIKSMLDPEIADQINVDTVERYQGSERDVIIISFAVNYEYQIRNIQSLVSLNEELLDRKLNVAITRARKHIILTGCSSVLKYSPVYRKMIDYIEKNGYYAGIKDLSI